MIYILANNIRSLYNVGSLFRLADGLGIDKLFLCGITGAPIDDIKHARQRNQIAKTALEGLDSVPWEHHLSAIEIIHTLKEQGVQIVALEQAPRSQPYSEANYQSSVCFILGHETDGVDQSIIDLSDMCVEIPMHGAGKSLNVISAASIVLADAKLKLSN